MRCLVNGQEIPSAEVARRGPMNFGQPFPAPATPLPYQLVVDGRELIKQIGDVYAQAVKEEIADAPFHQVGDWPVLDRLQELGYPPLEDLLVREPNVLAGLLREWLYLEILDLLLSGPDTGLPTYLVNTIDRVAVVDGQVVIEGQAYLHPQLAQGQGALPASVLSARAL